VDIDERDKVAQQFGVAPEQVERDTWADRSAPRDLWDLWALSEIGAIDETALHLFQKFGPTNRPPSGRIFVNPPSDAAWRTQLAGQTRLTVTAADALRIVREAWARVVG
jgi:hypothetical protein